jgi:hypothetical protein
MVETLPYQKSPANNGEGLPVIKPDSLSWLCHPRAGGMLKTGSQFCFMELQLTINRENFEKSMVIPMKSILKSVLLGLTCTMTTFAPVSGLLAQTMTDAPASQVSPEKLEMLVKLGEILNEQQKDKLEAGLAQGQEVKAILPTLDLSPQQKVQVLKVLESAKK